MMDPSKVEQRLGKRAQALGQAPLVPDGRAAELKASLAMEARREASKQSRGRWVFPLLGAAAALLLLMMVSKPPADFGTMEGAVAFLDSGGRVLPEAGGLRSSEGTEPDTPEQFLVEVIAAEAGHLTLRLGRDRNWRAPLAVGSLPLAAEQEWLQAFPWPGSGEEVLLIFSKTPIPPEQLDEYLERNGSGGLAEAFGCRVVSRAFPAQ